MEKEAKKYWKEKISESKIFITNNLRNRLK
jgi:hypothetical protein